MKLSDFLNEAYHHYGQHRGGLQCWADIDDFLFDEERCLKLLMHYLDLGGSYAHADQWNRDNLYRCQHIIVTFLMGLGIAERYKLLEGVNVINGMPDEYLWMLTSTIHDYGYLKMGMTMHPSLEEVDSKYRLLSDDCLKSQLISTANYSQGYGRFLTFQYGTIKNYYAYKECLQENNGVGMDGETVDHGIYGACKCYEDYCDSFITHTYPHDCIATPEQEKEAKSMGYERIRINPRPEIVKLARTEPLLYKTACLIAAQHNMFRSETAEQDAQYKGFGLDELLSTTDIAVTTENPLLYLLSIVDTIECTKRFEKLRDGDNDFGLSIKDVIENVDITFDGDSIIVDYFGLNDVIDGYWSLTGKQRRHEKMRDILMRHINAPANLQTWVKCESAKVCDFAVKIRLQ